MEKNPGSTVDNCPCGSAQSYSDCCEPLIAGKRLALTAEQLMRSRYTAYTKAEIDYLFETTHPDYRKGYDHEGTRAWAENSGWQGLEIVGSEAGTAADSAGEVEFIARYKEKGVSRAHHELANFAKLKGKWYFTEGRAATQRPITSSKVGRNDPCPCGSGEKYKKCCGK